MTPPPFFPRQISPADIFRASPFRAEIPPIHTAPADTGSQPRRVLSAPRLSAFALALGLTLGAAAPSHAVIYNDNIEISRKALKGKCDRAGGTYSSTAKGYSCRHINDEGSLVVVECSNDMRCDGWILLERPRKLRPQAHSGAHTGVIHR